MQDPNMANCRIRTAWHSRKGIGAPEKHPCQSRTDYSFNYTGKGFATVLSEEELEIVRRIPVYFLVACHIYLFSVA